MEGRHRKGKMDIIELLQYTIKRNASDLHLSVGLSPMLRIDGDLNSLNMPPLQSRHIEEILFAIMTDQQKQTYQKQLEIDFAYETVKGNRFRVNAFHQYRGMAAVLRLVPSTISTLKMIQAPSILYELASKPNGLVLVTGATGSGKSTTLAALVNYINTHRKAHILTIEDPIEFIHHNKQALVTQRELQSHTHSFSTALRSAMREDPDVILVGELRDIETIRLAMTAAETGHLVLSTMHTASAAKTINRIIDVFPGNEKSMIRTMLAESLQAVVTQQLVKQTKGGRRAVFEVMLATMAIRNLIRENKVAQIESMIQAGQKYGMQTMQQSLDKLKEH